jgi:hypothetical protein
MLEQAVALLEKGSHDFVHPSLSDALAALAELYEKTNRTDKATSLKKRAHELKGLPS